MATGLGTDYLVLEASTLGLRPGHWPRQITIDGVACTAIARCSSREGELEAVIYQIGVGSRVTVLND